MPKYVLRPLSAAFVGHLSVRLSRHIGQIHAGVSGKRVVPSMPEIDENEAERNALHPALVVEPVSYVFVGTGTIKETVMFKIFGKCSFRL